MKIEHFLFWVIKPFPHPSTVAEQTELLEVPEKGKILKLVQVAVIKLRFWSL